MKRLISFAAALLCLSFLLAPAGAAAAVEELEVMTTVLSGPGWTAGRGWNNNDRGDVVGDYIAAGPGRAFHYYNKTYTDVHPPGWTSSTANAVSSNGNFVVGEGVTAVTTTGFLYSGGAHTPLFPPGGFTNARARDVNNAGQVVGTGLLGGVNRGWFYEGGSYVVIPLPAGYSSIDRMFINELGHMAGTGTVGFDDASFFINGALAPIGPPGWADVSLVGLNDSDVIVGNGDDGMGPKCFRYSGGAYETISHPDWFAVQCMALNNNGDIYGLAIAGATNYFSFLYRDGQFYRIESPSGFFIPAAMNSRYEIVGLRQSLPADIDAIVLTVLPTPDLTAGGKDGPVGAGPAGHTKLRLSNLAWSFKKLGVEWWVVASTPGGTYSYDPFTRSWSPGLSPAIRMPLRDLKPTRFPPAPASGPGIYTYYLGVDPFANNRIDPAVFFHDILTVIRR